MNYYNEFDPGAAAWLKELIKAGAIPPGIVDTRSIVEVMPGDLAGFTQCHFFAGIGGWSLALALAGWRAEWPVWTGSCPCQPFSVAGKGLGTDDERHLWPQFRRLIADCKPARVFGEQVASKDGRTWLTGVRANLEALGYGVGSADLCAAGVGAPHIRQRLFWVADSCSPGRQDGPSIGRSNDSVPTTGRSAKRIADGGAVCRVDGLADSALSDNRGVGRLGAAGDGRPAEVRVAEGTGDTRSSCGNSRLGNADFTGSQGRSLLPKCGSERLAGAASMDAWSDYYWIPCADGKARRIKPGLSPLVNGFPGRVGLIRGYGNAICVQVAEEFIAAYMECA